jgi:hypothetical protein
LRDETDNNGRSAIASIERREIADCMVSICQRTVISPCEFDGSTVARVGAGCSNVPVM